MVCTIKRVMKLLAVVSLVGALSACSSSKQSIIEYDDLVYITFSWWGNDDRNEYTIQAVKEFEKLHPNISVKCNYGEWSGYQTKMDIQMASHTQSDVMQINFAWINQYSPNGDVYYDINQLSDVVDLSNFSQDELDFGMQNGSLNAVPISLNSQILYYSRDVYDSYGLELPTTWDDLFECAETMREDGVYPLSISSSKSLMLLAVSYTEQTTGHRYVSEDGTLGFDADDVYTMLDFCDRLLTEKVIPPLNDFSKASISDGTYAGTMAWITDATNYCPEDGSFVVGEFPTLSDGTTGRLGWYSKPSTMYAISAYTEYPEESGMLLDFLLNSTEMASVQKLEKGIPLSRSAQSYLEESDLLNGIQFEAFQEFQDHSLEMDTMSPYIENQSLIDTFQGYLDIVYYKGDSVESQYEELYGVLKDTIDGLAAT